MSLAVLIPTFRRNDSLRRALESVFAQSRLPDRIVVADNAPEAGAKSLVDALLAAAPCPVTYVHAEHPGVANARNAGFAACADMDRIAQLDDDESAATRWLEALETVADATGAGVVFGPVRPQASGAGPVRTAWLRRLYARLPDLDDGVIDKPWGCGNSLIDLRIAPLPDPPFDQAANEIGGEDDLLFARLKAAGVTFAWANGAEVIEHVEAGRGRWAALARRAFAFGQGPSQDAVASGRPVKVAGWMAVGAIQATIFAAASPAARLFGPAPCAACIDRAVQGAGKLIWIDRFAPRFYGAALAERTG